MKQYITADQINELSHDAKEKLLGWLLEHEHASHDKETNEWVFATLSIGQMIEFLDNWGTEYDFCVWKDVCANHPAQHLCDALWEEIKSVLNS